MQRVRGVTDHKTVRLLDSAVLFWVVLWTVLGVWTGITLWQAADVGTTISASGRSLDAVGSSLQSLSEVPVIGERPGELGAEVSATAVDITARGTEVRGQLRLLGVFLGIAIVGIPVTPILGLYLPLRVRRGREVAGIRRQLRAHGDAPGFQRYLAGRARSWLTYDDVLRLEAEDQDDGSGERRLADAELSRLGIARRAADPVTG